MTLLIKNVQIVGSDQPLPDRLDVFVSGEKIAAIGRFPGKKADETIEGQGCYLSPGFIDVDTESDHYLSLFTHPSQEDFLKQGVTTIVGGLCGSSLAPLIYGSLESIEDWTDVSQINVDWHSVAEFLKVLDKRRLGVNFATLIGHSTIRQALIGRTPRNLTKNELLVFSEVVRKSVSEGGFGLSTGLGYVQSKETPYSELKSLVSVLKGKGGLYATHLRREADDLLLAVEETIKLAKETGISTLISHFLPVQGYEKEYEEALKRIEALPANLEFSFSLYPFSTRILKLYTFLPPWAQKDDVKVMNLGLQDEWLRTKIIKDFPKINPHNFVVAQAPGNEALVGYSLADLKKIYSLKSFEETLLKLMISTKLQAIVFYKNINEDLILRAIKSPRSLVASNAASFREDSKIKVLKPERATSTFPKFLSLVQKENLLPIEEAIKKITIEPARKLGLEGRGVVVSGYFADLVGFSGEGTVNFVVLNGRVVVRGGNFIDLLNGKVLRHQT